MKNQTPIIIMNFSGIYKEEDFYKGDFWKGKDFRKDKEENTGENMGRKGNILDGASGYSRNKLLL